MDHYEVRTYAKIGFQIEQIRTYRPPFLKLSESDLVLVGGHFPGLLVFQDGVEVAKIECEDWVFDFDTFDCYLAFASLDRVFYVLSVERDLVKMEKAQFDGMEKS